MNTILNRDILVTECKRKIVKIKPTVFRCSCRAICGINSRGFRHAIKCKNGTEQINCIFIFIELLNMTVGEYELLYIKKELVDFRLDVKNKSIKIEKLLGKTINLYIYYRIKKRGSKYVCSNCGGSYHFKKIIK